VGVPSIARKDLHCGDSPACGAVLVLKGYL
jgi:hypothetical protein